MFTLRFTLHSITPILIFLAQSAFGQDPPPGDTLKIEGTEYHVTDLGPFSPSGAIYFMDGQSDAKVKVIATGQEFTFNFIDQATAICASAPLLYDADRVNAGLFTPAPRPLKPVAFFPAQLPDRYRRDTTLHLMQVISMDMQDKANDASLLIGVPYADAYPNIFFDKDNFAENVRDASSYGVVQSLTEYVDRRTGRKEVNSNGYPARSCFAVYHILKSKYGVFFNKKPTVMELQPNPETRKLALSLPPLPFNYEIINAPIPLFDVQNPDGPPVAEVVSAKHGSHGPTKELSPGSWLLR